MQVVKNRGIRFGAFNGPCRERAKTLFSKEPETIRWIDGFPPGSVLWDIGANVGCYSLYAASLGHTVVAIEPSPWTFAVLCQNIVFNKFDNVIPLCMVATDKTGTMKITPREPGLSRIELGTGIQIPANTIASLAAQYPRPTHLKIDTDGHDPEVLKGAAPLLGGLQSVIVEMGHGRDGEVIRAMKDAGFEMRGFHMSPGAEEAKVGMGHWYK